MSMNLPRVESHDVGAQPASAQASDRSFIATWMFAWLLGFLGVERFYLG